MVVHIAVFYVNPMSDQYKRSKSLKWILHMSECGFQFGNVCVESLCTYIYILGLLLNPVDIESLRWF